MPSDTTQILGPALSQIVPNSQGQTAQNNVQRTISPNQPQLVSQAASEKAATSLKLEGKDRSLSIPQKRVDGATDADKQKAASLKSKDEQLEPKPLERKSLVVA